MTTAVLNLNAKLHKKIQSRVEAIDLPAINWKLVLICGFFVCLSLLVFYVWQVNNLTKGYYLINSYENQIESLTQENKNLEVSFAESSFWQDASIKIQALDFQKADSVKYVQMPDSSVATIVK